MRDTKIIIIEIRGLLDELSRTLGVKPTKSRNIAHDKQSATPKKGALGAINMLLEEKFFDSPKEMSVVMDRLKEIGHYHKPTAISMNLLNLTKRRIFNRFKNKGTKNWEYVIIK